VLNELIPIKMYDIIKYYLAYQIAVERNNPLQAIYKKTYLMFKSQFFYSEGNALNDKKLMPKNVNLNIENINQSKGYSSWLQS